MDEEIENVMVSNAVVIASASHSLQPPQVASVSLSDIQHATATIAIQIGAAFFRAVVNLAVNIFDHFRAVVNLPVNTFDPFRAVVNLPVNIFYQIGFNWDVIERQAIIQEESEEMILNDMELVQPVNIVVRENRLPIDYVFQEYRGVQFSVGRWFENIRGIFGEHNWLGTDNFHTNENENVMVSNAVVIASASHSLQPSQVASMSLSDIQHATATIAIQIGAAFFRAVVNLAVNIFDPIGILETFQETELEYQNLGQNVNIMVWHNSLPNSHSFQGLVKQFSVPMGNGGSFRVEVFQ